MNDYKHEPILVDYIIKNQVLKHLKKEKAMVQMDRNRSSFNGREQSHLNVLCNYIDGVYEDLEIDHHLDALDLIDLARIKREQTIH